MSTVARATSIVVNALTAAMPVSCAPIQDDELVEKQYSDSRQPSYWAGKEVKGIRITVADKEYYDALKKGTRITSAIVKMESATHTDGVQETIGDVVTGTLTGGIVTEAVELESSTDGAPVEFAITMMLCRGKDGTEGTFEVT